jgi:hypothetical protein
MVNASDLFICAVAGLAMPLAMLDGFRVLAGSALPSQGAGFQLERRPLVWLMAILLGPGLFADRMLAAWREGQLSVADGINAFVITLGWATLYGFVVLSLVKAFLPI